MLCGGRPVTVEAAWSKMFLTKSSSGAPTRLHHSSVPTMKKFFNKLEQKFDESKSTGGVGGASPASVPDLDAPPNQQLQYHYRKQYGVNLGSWFTLEKWLTPSVFKGAKEPAQCELDIVLGLGPEKAKQQLEAHWDGFINDGDWKWMASHGINTVRLPIGYFHFLPGHPDPQVRELMSGTEYGDYASAYTGAWPRVERAIQTAAQHGIGVLVDLHGAPGAQNTDDHSGLNTGKAGLWDGMSSSKNQKRTIAILVALAKSVAPYDNVVGLELLNEPKNSGRLQGFYEDAIKEIQKSGSPAANLPIYLGDAWDLNHYSGWAASQSKAGTFLVVDHHLYRCFTKEDHSTSASEHARRVHPSANGPTCNMLNGASSKLGGSLIIGEWSSALNPGSLQGQHQEAAQKEWGSAQLAHFTSSLGGNYYWTLKKEGGPDPGWCLYTAIEKGVIPENVGRPRGSPSGNYQAAHDQAHGGHTNYWNSHGAPGDHAQFSQGFQQGWKDAEHFYSTSQNLIGFIGQWATIRTEAWKAKGGDGKTAWEFQHGCQQGIAAFNAGLRA